MRIIYKSGPDWLSRKKNHKENKDTEIHGMQVNMNAIWTTNNILECMTMHELQQTVYQDDHLQ